MSLVESMGAQRSDAHAWWSLVAPSAAAGRRVTDSASPGSAWIHRRPAFARPSAYWKSERCTSNDDSCTGIVHIRSAKGGALCANRAPRQTARSGTRGRRNSGTKPYLLRRFGQARTPNTARASHLSEWGRSEPERSLSSDGVAPRLAATAKRITSVRKTGIAINIAAATRSKTRMAELPSGVRPVSLALARDEETEQEVVMWVRAHGREARSAASREQSAADACSFSRQESAEHAAAHAERSRRSLPRQRQLGIAVRRLGIGCIY